MSLNTNIGRDQVLRETEKAVCVSVDRTSGIHYRNAAPIQRASEVWLPKRHVEWRTVLAYGEMLHVPAWLAQEKGL